MDGFATTTPGDMNIFRPSASPANKTRPTPNHGEWKKMCERMITLGMEVESLRSENQRLRRMIFLDPLTGLSNRAALERDILPRWKATACGALIVLDLDHFKTINDTHGHRVGDRVLEDFGRLVREQTRTEDEAARYGGEEFVVLLHGAGIEEAARIAERILAATRAHSFALGLRLTSSAGVAAATPPEWQSLFATADAALYRAKTQGRNRVECALETTPVMAAPDIASVHTFPAGFRDHTNHANRAVC